jgi:hypothetical protein
VGAPGAAPLRGGAGRAAGIDVISARHKGGLSRRMAGQI